MRLGERQKEAMSKFRSQSDDELARNADSGMAGNGAIVEAMRRLRVSTEKSSLRMERLTKRLVWLTIVLTLLTVVLMALGVVVAIDPALKLWPWLALRHIM
jgi:hypothetical protein